MAASRAVDGAGDWRSVRTQHAPSGGRPGQSQLCSPATEDFASGRVAPQALSRVLSLTRRSPAEGPMCLHNFCVARRGLRRWCSNTAPDALHSMFTRAGVLAVAWRGLGRLPR
eukprot:351280-Chlamydomonas_euryale.AAC.4